MGSASDNTYLSVEEVADRFMVNVSTVRRMIYRGDFPRAFKFGRAWRIPQADVEAFIEEQRRGRQTATTTSES